MQTLHLGYELFIEEMNNYTRVLTLDWDEYKETKEVAELVSKKFKETRPFLRNLS